jgi:hypothetical protein
MNADRSVSPNPDGDDDDETPGVQGTSSRPGGSIHNLMHMDITPRTRSPTPPRALFRSTTGKGVAFTDEDITFLVRFMEYRKYAHLTHFVHRQLMQFIPQVSRQAGYGRVLERCRNQSAYLSVFNDRLVPSDHSPSGSTSFTGVVDEILAPTQARAGTHRHRCATPAAAGQEDAV